MNQTPSGDSSFSVWAPRIIIGVCIVLLVYFTQRTYRFKGTYDETFLAPENLNLVRGPWAKEEYYKRGEMGYVGKPLFEATGEITAPTETLHLPEKLPEPATTTQPGTN